MLQESVIREIILWIEQNLESRLSLDTVADRSGYTKWHFQRLFKNQTGLALGSYIRARRLSCSAVALRLTNDSIMDISLRYRFDSQQTFCRAFKKQFNVTPSEYRKRTGWKLEGFCLPLRESKELQAQVQLVQLPTIRLLGVNHRYTQDINEWNLKTEELRRQYWQIFLDKNKYVTKNLYAIHGVDLSATEEGRFIYSTALDEKDVTIVPPQAKNLEVPQGNYLEIKFTGDLQGTDYNDIIYTAYGKVLAEMDIARGEGSDIENYVLKSKPTYEEFINDPHNYIQELNYYIPVIV
ncbi:MULTISPECIES: helix-turn-helix domain-containing protein [Providencia]|uniref:Right origin-binding protein n=1 Tax=Providencia heimbachae ATCC 35613 TaxID=1354272 RepID=A0A1B7JLH7_9GAMM|nr:MULTISPECIES: helix-turn-helix domain-containing protein [Providencia]MBP6123560.1 AraC family transcriptional regulator [Providencia sp.]MDD9339853.1 AraC family transcriptional regulator [Providencia heimbachae]NIH21936.1 AraC family transcriptional regulator [Providencia heimbachae]OAT48768.1 right origin-binding protein [Providencia heimbachae ATCC 35613]QCJ69429.1 right origin-binding protein [Providencia heimbachae]